MSHAILDPIVGLLTSLQEPMGPVWNALTFSHNATENFLRDSITTPYPFVDLPKAKYFFCLTIIYPMAIVMRLLPNIPKIRHLVNLFFGLWMCIFVAGHGVFLNIASVLIIYMIMAIFPPRMGRNLGLTLSFVLSAFGHLYRLTYSYMAFTLDWTLIQMLLTLKLTMFCFDIRDGQRKPEDIHHEFARHHRIVVLPGLLEFMGYCFFFPCLLVGPMQPMRDYLHFINGTLYGHASGNVPRGATREGLKRFAAGFAWLPLFITSLFITVQYCLTEEFMAKPLWWRIGYQLLASYLFKPMYYYVWLNVEGAHILMGYGYHGHKSHNRLKWDRASNVKIGAMEFATAIDHMPLNWNIFTGKWLKYYFYTRLLSAGWKRMANPITFLVSAFWHGFYPGYYMLFAFGPLTAIMASLARRKLNPYFLEDDGKTRKSTYGIYSFCCWLSSQLLVDYLLGSFNTLNWNDSATMFGSVYWWGHIVAMIWLVALYFLPSPVQKHKKM